MNELFKFMSEFFKLLRVNSEVSSYLNSTFPTSIKIISQSSAKMVSYLVCPNCIKVHQHTDCSDAQSDCKCLYNPFPNHPLQCCR